MGAGHLSGPHSGLGAVVLTGGSAVRLDGADKAGLEIDGQTLLERTLAALADVREIVVVGEEVPTSRPVTFRREDPPGGGPLAGLMAGFEGFPRPPAWVCALAVDMPMVGPTTIARLWRSVEESASDGALLLDESGRRQYLCGIYSTARLRDVAPQDAHGTSVHAVIDQLNLIEVESVGLEAHDVDTWADVRRLREALDSPEGPTAS